MLLHRGIEAWLEVLEPDLVERRHSAEWAPPIGEKRIALGNSTFGR
jgi:hypothetical protein